MKIYYIYELPSSKLREGYYAYSSRVGREIMPIYRCKNLLTIEE
jgi:hypothetical protein